MLKLENVTKIYGKNTHPSVDRPNLTVPEGCVYGFLGPNGAGKTTTIRMITGALKATEGTITIGGIDIADDPLAAKRLFGYVPDSQDMYDKLTGWEYLNFIADIYGVDAKTRKERAERYLSTFELLSAAGNRIQSYSRGMKQKIGVIGALIHQPPVWILDEPMVGLDPRASFLLKEEMKKRAAEGATVFFSTHVLEVAEKLCDRVGIISKGRLLAEGTPEELLNRTGDHSLEEVFLEMTEKDAEATDEK